MPASAEIYRACAARLLRKAEEAPTGGMRTRLLIMAGQWHDMAQAAEREEECRARHLP